MNPELPLSAFAVLGPWRGGTSLVTGILRTLGVYVGDRFLDAETSYCTYEDLNLRKACLMGFDERPGFWQYHGNREVRSMFLREWLCWATSRYKEQNAIAVGGKHPILCKLVEELYSAWNIPEKVSLHTISVVRSEQDIHRSWTRKIASDGSYWWPRPDREFVVSDLIQSRNAALESKPYIQIDFEYLRTCPISAITELATQCSLPLERVPDAARLVQEQNN